MHATKTCSGGSDGAVMALSLLRIGVGMFFLAFGAIKLFIMGPEAIVGMMTKLFGVGSGTATLFAWVVMLVEFLGGMVILAGSKAPRTLYTAALAGFAVITVVGYFSANGGDMKQLLWHSQLLIMIIALMVSTPKCPMGVTGSCTA